VNSASLWRRPQRRRLGGLGDSCQVVSVEHVIGALIELGYMDVQHQTWADLERGYTRWSADAGIERFATGPFDSPISLEAVSQVKICPGNSWTLLAAQAAGASASQGIPSGGEPAPIPPAPLEPRPPATPRPVHAGFAPENSVWAWAFVVAILGATWLYVRYDRRTRQG
jgi:hypothetical protein